MCPWAVSLGHTALPAGRTKEVEMNRQGPRWRHRALLALFASTAVLAGGAQAIAPAPAAALYQNGCPNPDLDWLAWAECETTQGVGGVGGGSAPGAGDTDTSSESSGEVGAEALIDPDVDVDPDAYHPDESSTMQEASSTRWADWRLDARNCRGFLRRESRIQARLEDSDSAGFRHRARRTLGRIRDLWSRYNCEQSLGVGGD
jgi:hypothetical protein